MNIKGAKTYVEQVELIKKKGFHIENEQDCIKFLKKANYYRLSAYYLPFRKNDGTFLEGISFSRIQRIYDFDSRLRALLFETIEKIEFYLRTQFSYYSGHKYGSLGYLEAGNYGEIHNQHRFLEKVEACIEENKKTLVVLHHKEKYGGKFPIWVIVEFFSMGMLSYFYSDMLTEDKKILATHLYRTSFVQLQSWLRCLTDLRNRCAHYSRLYYWLFPAMPKMPKGFGYSADRTLFSQLLMLKFVYPDHSQWNVKFVLALKSLVDEYFPDISLNII